MKVGDRVRIVSDNHTAGLNVSDEIGTIVKQAPRDLHWIDKSATIWIVETDKRTGGLDARGVGKMGHCWNVDERDLEEISVEERREDIESQLFRRFKSVKGVGTQKARECTRAAMEYLDSLVEGEIGKNTPSPDGFPWETIPLEWKWAAWDYDNDAFTLRVYREKPAVDNSDKVRVLWNGDDIPTPEVESYPAHIKPSTLDQARTWLFQRPE